MGTLWATRPVEASPVVATDIAAVRRVPMRADLARGVVEHRTFAVAGVPVRGAFEVVHRGVDGSMRVTASRRPVEPPQFLPREARIPAERLPELVARARGPGSPPEPERPPELVYLMMLGHPVLAWEVQLPLQLRPEPSRPMLWVSAMTGRLLGEREQVHSSRARVFLENPSATPSAVEVELTGIDVTDAGRPLDGARLRSLNCSTTEPPVVEPWWDEGECYPVSLALSDENGDFLVPLPEVIRLDDNVQPEDLYAEVSMYYHGERFLDVLLDKGLTEFKCEKSTLLANFRGLEPEGDLDYNPTNNAYYTNQCDAEKGATMLFGQGSQVDFGYDGDVVYHELGHGVVALLAPQGLSGSRLRGDASVVDAGGVNEALADYLSAMISEDPWLGDYVGRFWPSTGRPYVRTAENSKTCPRHTVGQVHNDGEPMMAALWATRVRVGEVLDGIVLEALTRLAPDSTLEEVSQTLLEVAGERRSEGWLDDFGYDVLRRSLDARGLIDCPRVITDPDLVAEGRSMYLRKKTATVRPFYPGPMQMRYEVEAGERGFWIPFRLQPRGSSNPVSARVLVKRGDTPIEFEYDLVAVDDPGDPTGQAGKVREVVLVSGEWDLEVEPEFLADDEYVARVSGLEPGEVVHVAIVNTSKTNAVASDVWIGAPGAVDVGDEAGSTGADAGSGGDPDSVHATGAVSSGCACAGGGERQGLVVCGLFVLAAWRRRWRS